MRHFTDSCVAQVNCSYIFSVRILNPEQRVNENHLLSEDASDLLCHHSLNTVTLILKTSDSVRIHFIDTFVSSSSGWGAAVCQRSAVFICSLPWSPTPPIWSLWTCLTTTCRTVTQWSSFLTFCRIHTTNWSLFWSKKLRQSSCSLMNYSSTFIKYVFSKEWKQLQLQFLLELRSLKSLNPTLSGATHANILGKRRFPLCLVSCWISATGCTFSFLGPASEAASKSVCTWLNQLKCQLALQPRAASTLPGQTLMKGFHTASPKPKHIMSWMRVFPAVGKVFYLL